MRVQGMHMPKPMRLDPSTVGDLCLATYGPGVRDAVVSCNKAARKDFSSRLSNPEPKGARAGHALPGRLIPGSDI